MHYTMFTYFVPLESCPQYIGRVPLKSNAGRLFARPEYTRGECMQVAAWLNGQDWPLQTMNMLDWPGKDFMADSTHLPLDPRGALFTDD